MTATPPSASAGLRSAVCHLDGERNRLTYRGYDVVELARKATFEEVAFLLAAGHWPSGAELGDFVAGWSASRTLDRDAKKWLAGRPAGADELVVLRTAVSGLDRTQAPDGPLGEAQLLLGRVASTVATRGRLLAGGKPVAPPARAGAQAAAFLRQLHGTRAPAALAKAFDAALVLRADNEFNPSTYAARVAASTGADLTGCCVAALAALAGPKHSAHSVNVLRMLEQVGDVAHAAAYVERRVGEGKKLPGFGHPVYRGEDPRTGILRTITERACREAGMPEWFALARSVEERIVAATGQGANVDYYLASLYRALDIPAPLYGAVFAVARVAGWAAHVAEQQQDPDLIRPRAAYAGPVDQRVPPRGR